MLAIKLELYSKPVMFNYFFSEFNMKNGDAHVCDSNDKRKMKLLNLSFFIHNKLITQTGCNYHFM